MKIFGTFDDLPPPRYLSHLMTAVLENYKNSSQEKRLHKGNEWVHKLKEKIAGMK